MAKETGIKTANIPVINVLPPQITRLKKEEDDETWISGEELYTEGSSDEENCRCKESDSTDVSSKESSLTLSKPLKLKKQIDKKRKDISCQRTHKSDLSVQSTSKEQLSSGDAASDEEEEYIADDEISWKVNREELELENEIAALQLHRQEYPDICKSMDKIFEDYVEKINFFKNIQNEHYKRQTEKFKEEIKTNIQFFDSAIDQMQEKLENIKQKTKQIQLKNRLRLKEIIMQGPPESKQLAKNSQQFFELYSNKDPANLSDDMPCETLKSSEKVKSKFSCVTMGFIKSLDAPSPKAEHFSNINSLDTQYS